MSDGNDKVEETKPAAKKAATKKAAAKKESSSSGSVAHNALLEEIIADVSTRMTVPEAEVQAAHEMRIHNMEESARQLEVIEAHEKKYRGWVDFLESLKK